MVECDDSSQQLIGSEQQRQMVSAEKKLGCPIGPPAFCETAMLKRVGKVKEILSKLPDIEDSQMETALLRSCLALPKVAFSLRTCPPCYVKQATASFDNIIREAHFPNGPG